MTTRRGVPLIENYFAVSTAIEEGVPISSGVTPGGRGP